MTESYDPYANAIAERINGVLKQEFLLEQYNVPIDVMKAIVKYVVDIYNIQRPHYSCGYLNKCIDNQKEKLKRIKKQHTMERAPLCVIKKLFILS